MDADILAKLKEFNKSAFQPTPPPTPPQGTPPPQAGAPAPAPAPPPAGGQVDPQTGLPIDPNTGMPMDPQTGMLVDPQTGTMIDPNTGQPVDPAAAGGAPGGMPPEIQEMAMAMEEIMAFVEQQEQRIAALEQALMAPAQPPM